MTPGLEMGASLSAVCVGLFVLTMVVRKRQGQKRMSKDSAGEVCEQKVD